MLQGRSSDLFPTERLPEVAARSRLFQWQEYCYVVKRNLQQRDCAGFSPVSHFHRFGSLSGCVLCEPCGSKGNSFRERKQLSFCLFSYLCA